MMEDYDAVDIVLHYFIRLVTLLAACGLAWSLIKLF